MDSFTRYSVSLLLWFGAIILQQHFGNSRELHREVACFRDRLRIDCGDHSFIAIHEAFFTTHLQDNETCGPPAIEIEHPDEAASTHEPAETPGCGEDIRLSINKRCSGSKKCSYSYHELADKKCPNLRGQYVVRYDCVRNNSIVNYCNTKLLNREGYFSSPGFPQYYPQLSSCAWTISASKGQTILLKVLHLHLRPATEVFPTVSDPDSLYAMSILGGLTEADTRCDMDSLTILEEGERRESLCGDSLQALKEMEIESGDVEINFKSLAFMPASGFLIYYKIQGCPIPTNPGGSRMVDGNSSTAVYICEGEKVFNDTLESERYLSCIRDHHWNDTLPPCISLVEVTTTILSSSESFEANMENATLSSTENSPMVDSSDFSASFVEDVIVPSILITVLLLGNIIVVITILIMRRRQKGGDVEEEDLNDPKSDPLISEIKDV